MIDSTSNNVSIKSTLPSTTQHTEYISINTQQGSADNNGAVAAKDQVNISYRAESTANYQYNMSLDKTIGDGLDLLRGLVLNIFKEQGLEYTFETAEGQVDLETLSLEKAQELVADDGYFGVEKTAERIFNFAAGIAGGDVDQLEAIKEGINSGFQEALEAFGGELPDISYDTYDAVMNQLDEWAGMTTSPEPLIQVKS